MMPVDSILIQALGLVAALLAGSALLPIEVASDVNTGGKKDDY